jgi:hypothetical protein
MKEFEKNTDAESYPLCSGKEDVTTHISELF